MQAKKKLTPLMEQYFRIKERYRDEILLFRMGDFYEMFDTDAVKASKILNITLTSRNRDTDNSPLCGIPYHSITKYLPRLLESGSNVAICEQVEDPKTAKGIVKREVIRVITPSTIIEEEYLDNQSNNYLCSIAEKNGMFGLVFIDISTQEIKMTSIDRESLRVFDELSKFSPTEIIASGDLIKYLRENIPVHTELDIPLRELSVGKKAFNAWKHETISSLPAKNLQYMAVQEREEIMLALFIADEFISHKGIKLSFSSEIELYNASQYMDLDSSTIKHLEIMNPESKSQEKTLFDLLNRTKTAMGTRMLRHWLLNPLQEKNEINKRLDIVSFFCKNSDLQDEFIRLVSKVSDIERINGRILHRNATPRDLSALADSLDTVADIKKQLMACREQCLDEISNKIPDSIDIVSLIRHTIADSPPSNTRDGGYINTGCNAGLADLVDIIENSQKHILAYENEQRKITGVQNLKVGYNKVFGYYIDIPKSKSGLVPDSYKKKQTLVNNERFVTDELYKLEKTITTAEERRITLEREIYETLLNELERFSGGLKSCANKVGKLDVFLSFSWVAQRNRYTRPALTDEDTIDIRNGRHPLVENFLNREFIPNDLLMENASRFYIITGPNMAGKSTYLRQNALIVLLAHIGSFVPAISAKIPIIDRVFTRIGSSDYLSKGMSTFLVEMSETALILKNSTRKSLILLDEVGRGTSTYDGISIAWAISEYIFRHIGAYTMFATHYNELTILADEYDGIKNYCIQVREYNNKLIFLRKIIPGTADRSYGIHVAEMAGIPGEIIDKARKVLANLESNDSSNLIQGLRERKDIPDNSEPRQRSLFEKESSRISDILKKTDISNTTPIEALLLLEKLKKLL